MSQYLCDSGDCCTKRLVADELQEQSLILSDLWESSPTWSVIYSGRLFSCFALLFDFRLGLPTAVLDSISNSWVQVMSLTELRCLDAVCVLRSCRTVPSRRLDWDYAILCYCSEGADYHTWELFANRVISLFPSYCFNSCDVDFGAFRSERSYPRQLDNFLSRTRLPLDLCQYQSLFGVSLDDFRRTLCSSSYLDSCFDSECSD
ncbi:hypothetical protein GQ53DRAFT_756628 [Thozetella sp. PMI_491]|nr:hypothetical protein GQ53DRAFT_756628 [Thozetella sp. PMI_491]